MAEKILGPAGSKRRKRFLWVPALLIACTALFVIGNAQAVHDLQFQLDGNADTSCGTGPNCKTSGTGAGQIYDWSSLFTTNAQGTPVAVDTSVVKASNTVGFTNATFTRDFKTKQSAHGAASTCSITDTGLNFCNSDDSTFATGSKDILPISPVAGVSGDWQCNQDNNVNSKIDIMNSYAAAYTAPNGDKVLYFGLDKNKDNGNNDVGFWFLQGDAGCTSPPTSDFTGVHTDGDILITSAFTSGGGVSNIEVFQWEGGANGCLDNPADPKLCDQEPFGSGGDCKTTQTSTTTAPADAICATTNSGTLPTSGNILVPWETADATLGVGHAVVPPDFFEGGIDLTLAFKQAGSTAPSCFNTFIADTRSSQEPTATLFDFTQGVLGECTATIQTTPSVTTTSLASTSAVTDLANIAGTASGGGTAPKPTGTVSFFLCGPSASSCTTGGTPVGNPVTLGNCNPDVAGHSCATSGDVRSLLTAVGTYCFRAVYDPGNDPNYQSSAGILDGSSTECFTVTGTSASSSAQRWLPNDRVTLTGDAALNGTLTVTLYSGTFSGTAANCTAGSATAVTGQSYTFTVTNGAKTGASFNTSNTDPATSGHTTFYVGTNPDGTAGGTTGTYFWLVHYDDNTLTDPTDRCETSTVSITN
jgi:hypothetical protein